ncbi:MAG TPA: hypothetical protein DIC53_01535 [Synergistaceae bacterium]|jgi:prepilin-type N-terminal cleavage/methylation domain-containing protein|nr:hypothetical protein [Synergistaceae bacterium]
MDEATERGRACVPVRVRRGLSLAELLVVLLIVGILFGGVALVARSSFFGPPSPERVRREGEHAAMWLQRVFHKGLLTGRSFVFRLSPSAPKRTLDIRWADDSTETYDGKGIVWFTNYSGTGAYCTYNPKWNMVTPAFTVEVGTSAEVRRPAWYVVVSPFCHVDFRKTPPRD